MLTIDQLAQPYHLTDDGGLSLDFHPGQWELWDCDKRFIFGLAGTQGGKTSFIPSWLHREIYHPAIGRGSGDYLAITATYDLFKLKFLPLMREYFEHVMKCGRYWAGERVIELRDPATGLYWAKRSDDPMWGRIILRSAESGSGLESSTANAAVLDECGMDIYTAETWRAIRRRLSLTRGRILGVTTLYVLYNWLKQLYDEWANGRSDIAFIQFASIINPSFPKEEYEQALREMPEHVVNMQYRGLFDKPPGMIYDCFDSRRHVIRPFPVTGVAYGGMDYGGVNTAAIRVVNDNGVYYVTNEYHEGGRTAKEHAADLIPWHCGIWRGGAKSEEQWRMEFRQQGIPVNEPTISDVWLGINKVYGLIKADRLFIFDTCPKLLGELGTYSRKINKATGEALPDEIMNKNEYHMLDALRYIGGDLSLPQTAVLVHGTAKRQMRK